MKIQLKNNIYKTSKHQMFRNDFNKICVWPQLENYMLLLRETKEDLNKWEKYHIHIWRDSMALQSQLSLAWYIFIAIVLRLKYRFQKLYRNQRTIARDWTRISHTGGRCLKLWATPKVTDILISITIFLEYPRKSWRTAVLEDFHY